MSVPSVTTAARKASVAMARAVATGMGPAPSSSQVSPSMVWPRVRAVWSTRTMTCAGGRRPSPSPVAVGGFGHGDEGVGGVGGVAFPRAGGGGLVFEGFETGAEAGEGVGGEAGVDPPGAVPVDPGAQRPGPVDRLVAALLVGLVGRGAAGRAAGVAHPGHGVSAGVLDETGAGVGCDLGGGGDLPGGFGRQPPVLPGVADLGGSLGHALGGGQGGGAPRRLELPVRRASHPAGERSPAARHAPHAAARAAQRALPAWATRSALVNCFHEPVGVDAGQGGGVQVAHRVGQDGHRPRHPLTDRNVAGTHAHTMQPTDRV